MLIRIKELLAGGGSCTYTVHRAVGSKIELVRSTEENTLHKEEGCGHARLSAGLACARSLTVSDLTSKGQPCPTYIAPPLVRASQHRAYMECYIMCHTPSSCKHGPALAGSTGPTPTALTCVCMHVYNVLCV